jgi:hypothetical protein
MASLLQEQQQQQQTSLSKPPPYPTSQPPRTSTVAAPRSRRKLQTPRPSAKTESPAIGERSGIRSNSSIVQNMLVQNRTSPEPRVPSIASSNPVMEGLTSGWGDETTATNHGTTSHTLTHMSEPLCIQIADTDDYPMSVQGSLGVSESSPVHKQVRGRRKDTGNPSTEYSPSMVMTTPTVSMASI